MWDIYKWHNHSIVKDVHFFLCVHISFHVQEDKFSLVPVQVIHPGGAGKAEVIVLEMTGGAWFV